MNLKAKIIYHSDKRPEVNTLIIPVTEGVWYVWIDWFDAFEESGMGFGEPPDPISLYFAHPASDGIDFEVAIPFPSEGHLFGSICKKSYHGTFYTDAKYEELWETGQGLE